ncbi:cytochrome bd-I ubiquinol oxidase subunit 1 apoprotein [Thermodesulfobium acidiphilum]|uniref:Cytochrome bd-I ubiquinol oxidase subunit 1 apoprotein n=1 Tax=Thermodesulfobium acidiphilum TaxID=1794699 RepID=A0A2R4W209_THEAF|nr:cytochrome ubiquinol oxidase subunit I [Thermodesulfobium acidiphilum]AWB10837.1 cytochrome bd-I ubiquinol oxidase subunit 1 apoprotein [Thermodesulfobium acidiphilum]
MDAVMLSRLQFGATAMYHFIFVPLTLGLGILVAIMETLYYKTKNEVYLKMTKFWGRLFLINFILGIVTGITLEFQFGTNWAQYSIYVGDIFGAPLAIEATLAFFLESTFLGVWLFGWKRISPKMHLISIWLVAFSSNLSALWILIANAWMQDPVGFVLKNNRAEMTDFFAVVFSPYAWLKFTHTITAGFVVGSFFVMGISAYHLLKKQNVEFFKKSFYIGATFGLIASVLVFLIGDFHAAEVAHVQPTKLAAMESLWNTEKAAPIYLILVPDESKKTNLVEAFPIPSLLSLLAYHDPNATVRGLNSFPENDIPPVTPVFLSFRIMVGLGTLFIILTILAWWYARKDKLLEHRTFLKIMLYSLPLPYIATQVGWILAEVGRQPWIVYGLLRTNDAVSKNLTVGDVLLTLGVFIVLYTALAVLDFALLIYYARKGPLETD